MLKKRICSLFLIVVLCVLLFPVSAAELPSEFWALNDQYNAAIEGQDYAKTVEYGSQIVNLILGEPQTQQTAEIIGSRAYETAFAYYFLGDYQSAAQYFSLYIPYGMQMNWADGVKIAQEFVKQLTSSLELYQYTAEEQVYYGARNEPHGVLYGQVSEKTQPDESMILLYLEYGDTATFDWARRILQDAQDGQKAVELALNFQGEGDDVRAVQEGDAFLNLLSALLAEFPTVPIYLRIGAEVNIWNNTCTPDEFKAAFRIISSRMRAFSNVAAVWSVAHTSRWQSAEWPYTADDFYPGDEYVDWVGVTAYPNKYFNGQTWSGTDVFNEICFKSGYSADPVLMIQEIVQTYGDRKPIMISECGSAYQTNGSVNTTHHEWAAEHLRQMYAYLPMVYPQVKLIAYFNKNISYEYNYYDLDGSPQLAAAYSEAVQAPWFIQNSYQNRAQTFFQKAGDTVYTEGNITLAAYPHLYGADTVSVRYYMDGSLVSSASAVPYTVTLSDIQGTHSLRVEAVGSNGAVTERTYTLQSVQKPENAEDFSDTAALSAVQKAAVDTVLQQGIMTGYEDGTLRPMQTITRAEFATMICRMMDYPLQRSTFTDAADHWASAFIGACAAVGAVNGVGENRFAPEEDITFEQAVKIVTVAAGLASADAPYPSGFLQAAEENGLLEALTSTQEGEALKRIDAAVLMAGVQEEA